MFQHADPTIDLANFGVAQLCALTAQNNWMLQQLCTQHRIQGIAAQQPSAFGGLAAGGGMPGYVPNWPQQAGAPIGTQLNAGNQGNTQLSAGAGPQTGTGGEQGGNTGRTRRSTQNNTKTARNRSGNTGKAKSPEMVARGLKGAETRRLREQGQQAAE